MKEGTVVILHLTAPNEKFWGALVALGPEGVTLRGISLSGFDDWMRGVARGEAGLHLSTLFVPMQRVVRMFADEPAGEVESYRQRFERKVGRPIEQVLGPGTDAAS